MQRTTSFPKSHRCSKPTLVKGGRRGFSHLLLFIIPRAQCASCSASATQPFLFKATLEARTTSWPLLSSCQRKAGKQGRAELAGKGGCLQAEGEPEQPAKTLGPWGQHSSGSTAAVPCPVLPEGDASAPKSLPAGRDKAPGSHGSSRRDGTVAGQGDWLPAWLVVRGR